MQTSTNERLHWIDTAKAVCMLLVYLAHSTVYSGYKSANCNLWLAPFYVNTFFFVSGYLFFPNRRSPANGDTQRRLASILYKLVIPTCIFSAVLFVPKVLFHGSQVTVRGLLMSVFGGVGLWFTAALTVAQLALVLLTSVGWLRRSMWRTMLAAGLVSAVGVTLSWQMNASGNPEMFFPWFWKTGLSYTGVMALGGLYRHYEAHIQRHATVLGVTMAITYAISLAYCYAQGGAVALSLSGKSDALGAVLAISSVWVVVALCKRLPAIGWLHFVGRHSIVFYFLSGTLPAAVGAVAQRLLPHPTYLGAWLVAAVSAALAYAATHAVLRWVPWLTDLRARR